jgi:hypothetical protein
MEGVKRQLKESKNLEGEPHRAIAVLREAVFIPLLLFPLLFWSPLLFLSLLFFSSFLLSSTFTAYHLASGQVPLHHPQAPQCGGDVQGLL